MGARPRQAVGGQELHVQGIPRRGRCGEARSARGTRGRQARVRNGRGSPARRYHRAPRRPHVHTRRADHQQPTRPHRGPRRTRGAPDRVHDGKGHGPLVARLPRRQQRHRQGASTSPPSRHASATPARRPAPRAMSSRPYGSCSCHRSHVVRRWPSAGPMRRSSPWSLRRRSCASA